MIGQGVGIIVLAGILGGSVLAPIKIMRQWRFEKSWAVYSVWAYLLMPWLMALLTIPHLFHIYPQVSGRTMLICALCGVGEGFARCLRVERPDHWIVEEPLRVGFGVSSQSRHLW